MNERIGQRLEHLRDELTGRTIASLSTGFTSGLGLLVAQVAFATLIFSGALAPYSSQGVGLILFGNFAACLIMAVAAGYRGVIAGLSPALVIGMAVFGSEVDAEGQALFVTVSAALILSAVITGVCCLALGRLRLANLLRFIPYPVSAGFVAGIGGAVCLAALALMGAQPHWQAIHELVAPSMLWKWGPGVAYGIVLYAAIKRWGKAWILPVSVAVVVGGYHLALNALGISGADARSMGLLLSSTAEGNLWPALGVTDVAWVDWTALAMQTPNMLALILVAFVCVVLNLAGLEVATNQELDWDREIQVGGLASVVAGIGGGMVVTVVVPASLRSKLLGAATRLTGVIAALVIGVALFFGDGMLEFVPAPLVGGILVFAGLGMLDEGLVRGHRLLPLSEFSIVVLIFVAIIGFGLLEGVGVGMLATLVFFAARLSRVDVIESHFTTGERRSNRVRPVPERAILADESHRVQAYLLRGYVFFGSVSPLADRLRKSLSGTSRPDCLLLDFAAVSGFDFSAVNVLGRLLQEAESAGVQVVLSGLPEPLSAGLRRSVPSQTFAGLLLEPNADSALERCEDVVIAAWKESDRAALLEQTADDLERHLERQIEFEELMEELEDWMDARDHAPGETMAASDRQREGLQLVLSGRVTAYDLAGARLYQRGPGEVVPLIDARDENVATVVADEPCRTMVLTPASRDWLETNRPELALKLYRYLADEHFGIEGDSGARP